MIAAAAAANCAGSGPSARWTCMKPAARAASSMRSLEATTGRVFNAVANDGGSCCTINISASLLLRAITLRGSAVSNTCTVDARSRSATR